MLIELLLLTLLFVFSYANVAYQHSYKELMLFFIFPILILITVRQLGYDLNNYYSIYSEISNLDFSLITFNNSVGLLNKKYEPTFHILVHFSSYYNLGFRGVLFLFALMTLLFLSLSSLITGVKFSPFISAYILIAFLPGPYEAIRSAIAIVISLVAIAFFSNRSYLTSFLFILLAFFFHKTIILMPLLYFLYCFARYLLLSDRLIYAIILFAFPITLILLNVVIDFLGFNNPVLVSINAILMRDGKNSFENSTELLKYILILGRCLFVFCLVYFINKNISSLFLKDKNIRISIRMVNLLVFLSISLMLSNQFIIASRVAELSFVLVAFLLVKVLTFVSNRKSNLLLHFSCFAILVTNLVFVFLMYLLPSGVPV